MNLKRPWGTLLKTVLVVVLDEEPSEYDDENEDEC
jgi:hypothetical protein